MASHPAEKLFFLDESGAVLNLTPLYGYAPKGQRVHAPRPVSKGQRVSTIGALGINGLLTALCYEGTLTGEVFTYFITAFLLPCLSPGSVLILDNASPHKNHQALELLAQAGVHVLSLPPYSPEMNPIEYCWAKAKHRLRSLAPRTLDQLYDAWTLALEAFDSSLALACFQHCGFCMKH